MVSSPVNPVKNPLKTSKIVSFQGRRQPHPARMRVARALRSRRQGAMLIIAMGVLTLLAVLGTTFVSLMRLEKQATRNYIDAQLVDLINESALERVISDMRGLLHHLSYSSYNRWSRSPWLFKLNDRDDLANGVVGIESPRVGRWDIHSEDESRVFRYKTKIIDTSTQININGRQDTVARMLENLALAIVRSERLGKGAENPLYTGPKQTGELLKGVDIIRFRNKLEGGRFRTKTQLRELIGQRNYDTIKDFITIHSWEDPYTFGPADGIDEVIDFGLTGSGGGGNALGGSTSNTHPEVVSPASRITHEPRSPVNINLATEEVLIACLMGVGGRRPFPYSRIVYGAIDEGADIRGQRVPGTEELDNLLPRAVWVYAPGLEYEHAQKIARRIIQNRKTTARQFMTWSSGDSGRQGFAEFINTLEESFFPNPTLAVIVDPTNPADRTVERDLKSGTEISTMWRRGHDQRERAFRRQFGMPFHQRNAFYYDLVKAAIIANANPNTRLNRYNPNVPAYTAVDKSDLVVLDKRDRRTPRNGYTTEFTFDSTGVFEVTTLAQIAQVMSALKAGEGGSTSSQRERAARLARKASDGLAPLYQKKMRTVVKVFDVLRHTNQFHFERTFQAGSLSSRNDRRYVVTWPDPMHALTDAVSAGSIRDGRVELAGQADGQRLLLPPSSRLSVYQSPQSLTMSMGFQDRDDSSYSQLKRLVRSGGGLGSPEFTRHLTDIYNASYSRIRAFNRDYYRRESLVSRGIYTGGSSAEINLDPLINTENFGTDLFPDGFHTSVFTMSHLGGRFVYLPAHGNLLQVAGGKGGRGALAGAAANTNLNGNVPYYSGGVAFWVKFEFDARDPVFSGLVGCTQVIEDAALGPAHYEGSEGTQFYIFKNTKGQLRVVRMYYRECFQDLGGEGGDGGGGDVGVSSGLVPDFTPVVDSGSGGTGEMQKYLDPQKPVARSDVLLDIKHFKAREWHHIAVDFQDDNPGQPISVWLDFERVQAGGPFIPQENIEDLPTAWVRLNVRRPRDGLFIGGFIRKQKVSDSGVFKWFSNTFKPNQGSATVVERPIKRVLANATIDEFVAYTGTFSTVRRYFVPRGAPGYFSNQTGTYANVFDIPLPPEIDHVVMRSFDWTSYYPTFFTGGGANIRAPVALRTEQIRGQAQLGGKVNPSGLSEGWRTPMIRTAVSNKRCVRRQSKGLLGRSAELVYKFTIPPGVTQTGSMAGGAVQTPVIDDVTATYFLPDARILHQEEVD